MTCVRLLVTALVQKTRESSHGTHFMRGKEYSLKGTSLGSYILSHARIQDNGIDGYNGQRDND